MSDEKLASTILPFAVREQLMAAAKLDPTAPPGESFARIREIDGITVRAKLRYPKYFKQGCFSTTKGN